jgi:hypothetical protein
MIDFSTFMISIASAAMMGLGLAPRPDNGKTELDLNLARQNIDLLQLLQQKTKGNLTPDEATLLDKLLLECRTKYVEEARK